MKRNMKKLGFLVVMLCAVLGVSAQIHNPVKWSVASKKLNNNEAVVFIKATIDNGWHIYGKEVAQGGPVATSFDFKKSNEFTLMGNTLEPKPKTKYEDVFKMDVPYHANEVVFQQKVKLKNGKANVSGTVEFMACDKNQCLPPDEYNFTLAIK